MLFTSRSTLLTCKGEGEGRERHRVICLNEAGALALAAHKLKVE